MSSASFPTVPFADASVREPSAGVEVDAKRLRAVIDAEHPFVWRSIRRLGVPMSDVDDAVQKVFLIAARRLNEVPNGRERGFLFATSMRVASNERRAERRKRSAGPEALEEMTSPTPSPEQTVSNREVLDSILEELPIEIRSVVVLYELEQMTTEEIGEMLDLPVGTVASRIRRGRELIEITLKRLRAREGGLR